MAGPFRIYRQTWLDDIAKALANIGVIGKVISGSSIAGPIPSTSIPDTAVTPGTYGDTGHVGQFTVGSDGRLTFADNVAISAGGMTNPMTTEGDIIYQHSGSPTRKPIGAAKTALMSDGTDPVWADPISNAAYRWVPLTTGDPTSPGLVFDANGECIMVLETF